MVHSYVYEMALNNNIIRQIFNESAKYLTVPDPRGAKGAHAPPEAPTRHTLPPEKKVNFWSYDPTSVMQKQMVQYQCELLILIQYLRDYRV